METKKFKPSGMDKIRFGEMKGTPLSSGKGGRNASINRMIKKELKVELNWGAPKR